MTTIEIVFAFTAVAMLPLMVLTLRMVGLVMWIISTACFGAMLLAPTWLLQVLNGVARFFNSLLT